MLGFLLKCWDSYFLQFYFRHVKNSHQGPILQNTIYNYKHFSTPILHVPSSSISVSILDFVYSPPTTKALKHGNGETVQWSIQCSFVDTVGMYPRMNVKSIQRRYGIHSDFDGVSGHLKSFHFRKSYVWLAPVLRCIYSTLNVNRALSQPTSREAFDINEYPDNRIRL